MRRLLFWLVCGGGILAACASPAPTPPATTAAPVSTLTATPTVVWFPPTATPSPVPAVSPTPVVQLPVEKGARVLFDALRSAEGWRTGAFPAGTVTAGEEGLTLAVSASQGRLIAWRESPVVGDFFAQVVAAPALCRGEDQYGLLFRMQGEGDFFRLVLTCDGRARLDLVLGGHVSVLRALTSAPVVPPGAPATVTLGVRAQGKRIQTFVEGVLVFEVEASGPRNGRLGLFARAAGETPVTVTFRDLAVYDLP